MKYLQAFLFLVTLLITGQSYAEYKYYEIEIPEGSSYSIDIVDENGNIIKQPSYTDTIVKHEVVEASENKNNHLNFVEEKLASDSKLKNLNSSLETVYANALNDAGIEKSTVEDSQYNWIIERNECKSYKCLVDNYEQRIKWFNNKEYRKLYAPKPLPQGCAIPSLPRDCEVYGITNYGNGEDAHVYVDERSSTKKKEIYVNRPNKCVFLFLSAYEPMIWDIYATEDTNVVGVVAGGYYKRIIRGFKTGVFTDINSCVNKYYDDENSGFMREKIRALGLPMENYTYINDRENTGNREINIIGEKVSPNEYLHFKENIDGEILDLDLPPGKDGIKKLIATGKIRKVSSADFAKIKEKGIIKMTGPGAYATKGRVDNFSKTYGCDDSAPDDVLWHDGCQFYIMLEQFTSLPNGLAGAHSIEVYVPMGLNAPKNEGHSDIYLIKSTIKEVKGW